MIVTLILISLTILPNGFSKVVTEEVSGYKDLTSCYNDLYRLNNLLKDKPKPNMKVLSIACKETNSI